MNVAIVHYHLNRGGVTQVIANHLRSLDEVFDSTAAVRGALLYGGRRKGWSDSLLDQLNNLSAELIEIPDLDYDAGQSASPAQLYEQLDIALRSRGWIPSDTVIHVHNHGLGKNLSLPGAIHRLAQSGYAMLLQIHDFAEDYRPDNYRRLKSLPNIDSTEDTAGLLYPQAPNIHYAVLNRRDWRILRTAGTDPRKLHVLPNPVLAPGPLPDRWQSRRRLETRFHIRPNDSYLLYPVRCIRRKNLGEVLLWSALLREHACIGLTLPPLNKLEMPNYRRWQRVAKELKLPCRFEVGGEQGLSYAENLSAADKILTTSVAEGFGMVFLESWLVERILVGRDLPEVTTDFAAAGVSLETLKPHFQVPLELVSADRLRDSLKSMYRDVMAVYGRTSPTDKDMERYLDELTSDGLVDFASLSSELQYRVVVSIWEQPHCRNRLLAVNPWFSQVVEMKQTESVRIAHRNAKVVRDRYCPAKLGHQLDGIYRTLLAAPRDEPLSTLAVGDRILEAFLAPARLQPVRVETP